MIRNYFVTAWRNLVRNRLYSVINLVGLSSGIAAVLLIGIYVQYELSYDSFHQNKAWLYRVGFEYFRSDKSLGATPEFTPAFGRDIVTEFPEIQSCCRISEHHQALLRRDANRIKTEGICYADSTFFRMFSFRLIAGNPTTVLSQPNTIVLTATLAGKLFGNEDATGKTVVFNGNDPFLVTGVCADVPDNSQISYEALVSMVTLYQDTAHYFMDWNGGNQYITYLRLNNLTDAAALEKKLSSYIRKKSERYQDPEVRVAATLQPISEVHLRYDDDSLQTRTNLYVFGVVSLLILIISCVNYVNLVTARASSRFREIGVRKVLGAAKSQIIRQFLGESVFMTVIAFLLSLVIVFTTLPVYTRILGKPMLVAGNGFWLMVLLAFLVIVMIGVGAGSYLAFYFSSLNAQTTLKFAESKSKHHGFRKGLIVIQFAVATALMTCTLIMNLQMQFVRNKTLGFDKDQILVLPLTGDKTKEVATVLKQQLGALADVESVSALSEIPYNDFTMNGFLPEGSSTHLTIHQLDADEDMLKTFRFRMVSGDYFSKDRPSGNDGYIINETLARMLGWDNPVGKTISRNGRHVVNGVIHDFNFSSLHNPIGPLIITNHPWQNQFDYLAVRYRCANPAPLLSQIKTRWDLLVGDAPFEYWFLDEAFDKLYKNEERFHQLFFSFSILSIVLSLAGIFGLVSLTIRQRTREIGIRKVLGAGTFDIVGLTTRSYLLLILAASVIAVPFSIFYMNRWLQDFAYRINPGWWMYIIAGLVTTILALLTIGIQSLKAARRNPIRSLRTE